MVQTTEAPRDVGSVRSLLERLDGRECGARVHGSNRLWVCAGWKNRMGEIVERFEDSKNVADICFATLLEGRTDVL